MSSRSLLNPTGFVPLYMQLATHLRDEIHSGRYAHGDQLPSEPSLARDFKVSRATATAALDEVVRANEAHRIKGRGTFVSRPFISKFSLATSFTEDMVGRGRAPSSSTIKFSEATPSPEICARLGARPEKACYRLERLRMADGDPVALQTAYLPADLYPGLNAAMFDDDHLYNVMRRAYALKPVWAEAIVEAALPDKREADLLQISTGDPVLVVWHLSLDGLITSLEFVRSVYRSDRFSFATGRQSTDLGTITA